MKPNETCIYNSTGLLDCIDFSNQNIIKLSFYEIAHPRFMGQHDNHNHHDHLLQQQPQDEDDECMGMYMTMFMDGFHWTSTTCLSFFVSSWKLTQTDAGACLFSFLLAILMESLLAARSFLLRRSPDRYGLFLSLYLLQAILGYLLMLIAMSFSVPLVASLIFGLMVGHYLFSSKSSSSRRLQAVATRGSDAANNTTDDTDEPQHHAPENSSSMGSVNLRRRG